uniref:Uncharacterized protein n=1 Tax=Rhizophora mucronata TaxID=61149 RepID=A0A2P2QL52_RHIMU
MDYWAVSARDEEGGGEVMECEKTGPV